MTSDEFLAMMENPTDPLLIEINALQKDCTSLSHEKLAVVAKIDALIKGSQENLQQACEMLMMQDQNAAPTNPHGSTYSGTLYGNPALHSSNDTRRARSGRGGGGEKSNQSDIMMDIANANVNTIANTSTSIRGIKNLTSSNGSNSGLAHPPGSSQTSSVGLAVKGLSMKKMKPSVDSQQGGPSTATHAALSSNESSCPLCNNKDNDLMVLCDSCQQWLHYSCADYLPPVADTFTDEPFFCPTCLGRSSSKIKKRKKTGVIEI